MVFLTFWGFVLFLAHFGIPKWAAASVPVNQKPPPAIPELLQTSVEELRRGLRYKQFTSVQLVHAYLKRIEEVNSVFNAVLEVNPQALEIAKALDGEREAGVERGPLHGIPIFLKDNIDTFDELNTTAGSFALLGSKVSQDATTAYKLRASGAILLGKLGLSQWANFRSTGGNSSNGWSARGGQVYGAYYPEQDPSGSSSGSGVATALGLALAALGTETDGSIISPSELNSVVGIKPTVGLTSRAGVVPISQRQDTVGPMTKTVLDAAYILQIIAGKDERDNYTSAIPFTKIPDYVAACTPDALQGKRIGVPRNTLDGLSPAIISGFNAALKTLEDAGATIVDNTNYTTWEEYLNSPAETTVLDADFIANLKTYLSQLTFNPNNVTDLQSVRAYTQRDPREDYPDRDTGEWDEALALNFTNTSPEFWAAYQQDLYFGGIGGILGALKNYSLDALVAPTDVSSSFPAIIGAPVIQVPLGFFPNGTQVQRTKRGLVTEAPNVPFGLSFTAEHWSEEKLLGFAYAFEWRNTATTGRFGPVKPWKTPKTDLKDVIGKKSPGLDDIDWNQVLPKGGGARRQEERDVKRDQILSRAKVETRLGQYTLK